MGVFRCTGWFAKQGPKSSTASDTVDENPFSLQPKELEALNEVRLEQSLKCNGALMLS